MKLIRCEPRRSDYSLATVKVSSRTPIDPHMVGQIGVLQSTISAFLRIHQPPG